MPKERAKLFTHGGSQAVRLPKAFRFEGKEVCIRRDGDRVILEPVGYDADAFWARIDGCLAGVAPEHPFFAHLTAGLAPTPDLGAAP